jgi:hypothetical protein
LKELGIADKISTYSYQANEYVYLEEDCDAGVFLRAKYGADVTGRELNERGLIVDRHSNHDSFIRGLEHFRA